MVRVSPSTKPMLSRFLLLENSLLLKNALDLRDLVIVALTHCGKQDLLTGVDAYCLQTVVAKLGR